MNCDQASNVSATEHSAMFQHLMQKASAMGLVDGQFKMEDMFRMFFIKSLNPKYEVLVQRFNDSTLLDSSGKGTPSVISFKTMTTELAAADLRWKHNDSEANVLSFGNKPAIPFLSAAGDGSIKKVNVQCTICNTSHWQNSRCPPKCKRCSLRHFFGRCKSFSSSGKAEKEKEANSLQVFDLNKMTSHWYLDTGATVHLALSQTSFSTIQSSNICLTSANGASTQVSGSGQVSLRLMKSNSTLRLDNVLLMPNGNKNLISMVRLSDTYGWRLNQGSKDAWIYDPSTNNV